MMEALNLSKKFGDVTAVNDVSLKIQDQQVFGLVGTNGAGKSTFLRMACGVLQPDEGSVCIDGRPVYDNPSVKQDIFFIPNDFYYFPNSTPDQMAAYFQQVYPSFDRTRFQELLSLIRLGNSRKIASFSKGMKKQLAIILGLCSKTKYLLCDETFDGLDPVMRQVIKSLFAQEMEDRGLTPLLTSHNLREIEDICDHVGLLHEGGVLLSEDMDDMKVRIQKVQCVFRSLQDEEAATQGLEVLTLERRGRLVTMTIKGTRQEIENYFRGIQTVFFEVLPLTLEEIFICETEAVGYDIRKFILA